MLAGQGRDGPSPTCTSTPSTRCSTAPRGSTTSSPPRRPTASRRWRSPTTATCTASSTSTRSAARRGITPIIGTEAYMAANSRTERPVRRGRLDDTGGEGERGEKLYYHLTLLAETTPGLPQPHEALLRRPTSRATTTSHAVDWELLEHYHEGLIATTGCLGGVVAPGAARGAVRGGARSSPGACRTSSAASNLFVELQDHGIADQRRTNPPARRDRPGDRRAARSRRTTATTAGARTPSRTTRCSACRPARRSTTRSASSSRARSTT